MTAEAMSASCEGGGDFLDSPFSRSVFSDVFSGGGLLDVGNGVPNLIKNSENYSRILYPI